MAVNDGAAAMVMVTHETDANLQVEGGKEDRMFRVSYGPQTKVENLRLRLSHVLECSNIAESMNF